MNGAETYALVIGINTYAKWPHLGAACADADTMDDFLKTDCKVPAENIINLRDGEATRQAILDGFKKLEEITNKYYEEPAGNPTEPRLGPCMIIFFAGHGARTAKPEGWGDWAPDSTQVEMLCPSDLGMPSDENEDGRDADNSKLVEGIPDRTICWLLNQLSMKRGNNITLILDCCHSAGINRAVRGDTGMISRRILHPPQLSCTADPLVDWSITEEEKMDPENDHRRAMHQHPGFGGKFHESHVLLSACGKEQTAREGPMEGLFSHALFKVLKKELNNPDGTEKTLTYSTLMSRLVMMPPEQTPHCEGSNINRLLFTRQGPRSDPLFISCRKTYETIPKEGSTGEKKWTLTLDAGEAQGIAKGELFSIHENNLYVNDDKANPSIGILCTTEVSTATSILGRPAWAAHCKKGKHFYAVRIDWSKDPQKLFCDDRAWLFRVFPQGDYEKPIIAVDDKSEAALILEVGATPGKVVFSRNDPFLEECQVDRAFGRMVSTSNHKAIRAVVGGLQHFNSHLGREGVPFPNVRMELHFLEEIGGKLTDDEAQQPENFRPQGGNLLISEPTTLKLPSHEDDEKPLGVTLHNDGDDDLYPYLFYFDPNDLTISPWYLVPTGAGEGKVDPPLKKHSTFCVGYGNGAATPWSFHFEDDRTKDVGYFKLFLSVSPVNFESLIRQASPFDSNLSRSEKIIDEKGKPDRENFKWGAKLFTIIQECIDAPVSK